MLSVCVRDDPTISRATRHSRLTPLTRGAALWPPVYTKGRPQAGDGVRPALLGSIRRKDGRRQVTYAGQPLYHYVHESAGQVLCHDVDLNGGLWWVVGPNGKRRP